MKRVLLVFLPAVLFGLETVNLIKDASFEKDSELWLMRSEADGEFDSIIVDRHDSEDAYLGEYCGTIDGRIIPSGNLPEGYYNWGYLYQVLAYPKKLKDIDTLDLFHRVVFIEDGGKARSWVYAIKLAFYYPANETSLEGWYRWRALDLGDPDDEPTKKFFTDTICDQSSWNHFLRNINSDFVSLKGLSSEIELDSFLFFNHSINYGSWRGQKAFFDGIRLMGYADYDVGVKEILSTMTDTPYQPVARIKNFGRENADSFLVIAEMDNGSEIVWADTLPWSLTADTEDTVTFGEFNPDPFHYTLTVRTEMTPDESDEDDEKSIELDFTGIAEPVTHHQGLNLEVFDAAGGVLKVTFKTPERQIGNLTLFDASGRRVDRMTVTHPGSVNIGTALASGVYIVRLETEQTTITKKAVVLK